MGKRFRQLTQTATDSDFVEGNYFGVDTPNVTKKVPANLIAKASDVSELQTNVANLETDSARLKDFISCSFPVPTIYGQGQSLNYEVGQTVSLTPISAQYRSAVVDCVEGEMYYIKSSESSPTYLCYGFIDSSDKLLYKSGTSVDAVVRVPENAVKLIYNNAFRNDDYALAKITLDVNALATRRVSLDDVKSLRSSISLTPSKGQSLNYEVGQTVSLTPISAQCRSAVVDCVEGEMYHVRSTGTTNYRAYGLLDSNNRLLYKSPEGLIDEVIRIPSGAYKLIFNNYNSYETPIFGKVSIVPSIISESIRNDFALSEIDGAGLVECTDWQIDRYISIADVGSVQSYSSSVSASHNKLLIKPCVKNQKFVITGTGPSTARAWAFVDSSDVVVAKSGASVTLTNAVVIAPCDGKIISTLSSNGTLFAVDIAERFKISDALVDDLDNISLYEYPWHDWTHDGFVRVGSKSVGDIVDETDFSSGGSYKQLKVACNPGDTFIIYGTSGNTFRRYCFIDADDVILAMDAASQSVSEITVTAPFGTVRAIFEAVNSDQYYVKRIDRSKTIDRIEKAIGKKLPLVHFNFEDYIPDVSEISEFDFAVNESGLYTIIEQVQDKMDALVEAHPDLIIKYDAYEYADVEYPAYADGIAAEGTYKVTPRYRTYMYKIGKVNSQTPISRKKVLFISGTHGAELAAPVNTYLFCKKLCETESRDLFQMLAAYDFYVIPCLNGYGMYHLTRANGNKVDINRNYPVAKWSEGGQDTMDTDYSYYTGPSAGSEKETQMVMAIAGSVKPDLLVDHHNYSANTAGSQIVFYASSYSDDDNLMMYQTQADISANLKVKKPTIFGTEYGLLYQSDNYWYSPTKSFSNGTTSRWGFESPDVGKSTTFEISACIPVNASWYGQEVFEIGGYMLRAFMTHYLDYIQER